MRLSRRLPFDGTRLASYPSVPRSRRGNDLMTEEAIKVADLALTNHALSRMYARRLSERAVQPALQHGCEAYGRGVVIFAIGQKEVMHALTSGIDLTGYEGHVVCSP